MAEGLGIFKTVAISAITTCAVLYAWTKYSSKKPVPALVIPSPPLMPITFLDNTITNPTYTYTLADGDCEVILQAAPTVGTEKNPNEAITRNINFVFPSKADTPSANLYNGRTVNITNLGFGNDAIYVNNNGDTEKVINVNTNQESIIPGFMENSLSAFVVYTNNYNSWTCVYNSADDSWYCFCRNDNNNYKPYYN